MTHPASIIQGMTGGKGRAPFWDGPAFPWHSTYGHVAMS